MLLIDLLVLVLHMVREIWRKTDRIKAGKNFKVTEPKFSNVTALNGLANLCYHLHFPSKKTYLIQMCNTKRLQVGNMPQKSSEL